MTKKPAFISRHRRGCRAPRLSRSWPLHDPGCRGRLRVRDTPRASRSLLAAMVIPLHLTGTLGAELMGQRSYDWKPGARR